MNKEQLEQEITSLLNKADSVGNRNHVVLCKNLQRLVKEENNLELLFIPDFVAVFIHEKDVQNISHPAWIRKEIFDEALSSIEISSNPRIALQQYLVTWQTLPYTHVPFAIFQQAQKLAYS